MHILPLTTRVYPGLGPGEPRASVRTLTPTARTVVLVIAFAVRLEPVGRYWFAKGHPEPISRRTVESLRKRGLVGGTARRRKARLTETGRWYARTLVTDLAEQNTQSEIAPICHAS
jgi:hypothetical protein